MQQITLQKEIEPYARSLKEFAITSPQSLTEATEYLSKLNKYKDALEEDKEKLTKPLLTTLKAIREKYKPTETLLEEVIVSLRTGMSHYQTQQLQIQKEKEDKIASRIGDGKGKIKLETATKQLENMERPAEKILTSVGSVKFRAQQRLVIENETKMKEYIRETGDFSFISVNESNLLTLLKTGHHVPGAKVETIQVPINNR